MSDQKVLEYAIVKANNESSLQNAVNVKIQEGFAPFGPLILKEYSSGATQYLQAVVKYAP